MAFIVELVESQLDVRAIHRAIRVPGGSAALVRRARPSGSTTSVREPPTPTVLDQMQAQDALALVTSDGVRLLRPKADRFAGARALDSVRLDLAIAGLDAERHL